MLGSGLAHSPADGAAFLMRIGSALGPYIRLNAWLWTRPPSGLRQTRLSHAFGTILHKVVRRAERRQFTGTFFSRNRPQLEWMRRLSALKPAGATLSLAILGCSIGAEIYSILSTVRSAMRPQSMLKVRPKQTHNRVS